MVPEICRATQQTQLFAILDDFLLFYLTNYPENFEKKKNANGDIIILQMSAINHDHVMYGS